MKKLALYSLMLSFVLLGFTSCNDDEDMLTDSVVTSYVNLHMQGDGFVQVPIGTSYTDAGCTADVAGEDVTSTIVTTGLDEVDVNKVGLYYITYSATNKDGFSATVSRTVAVCDPSITTDLSGVWTGMPGTKRVTSSGEVPYPGYSIKITQAAPGIFYVSDYLGGYYDQRAGYGSAYAMKGYVQLLADNSLEILSGDVPGWGDSYDDFEGSYDPVTGTISYVVVYAGMDFNVVLSK